MYKKKSLAWFSVNEHAHTAASLQLDEMEPEEWKEGNFLPVVCGTESSAAAPVLSFSSGYGAKSKVSDGNDTGVAHTGGYIWSVMEEDWADVKDGGLGNECLVSRYISPTSRHHQSSFTILFLGPSVFFSVCRSVVAVVFCWHSSLFYRLSSSTTNRTRQDTGFKLIEDLKKKKEEYPTIGIFCVKSLGSYLPYSL